MGQFGETFRKYKIFIIGAGVVLVAFLLYLFVFKSDSYEDLLVRTDTQGTNIDVVSLQLLTLLSSIKSIEIDTSFFDDERFKSLTDFTVEIEKQPVGRENPFLPFMGELEAEAVRKAQ